MTSDIKKAVKHLEKEGYLIEEFLCCMENTGIYNNLLLKHFLCAGYQIWVANAVQIKYSIGKARGKTDKVDAARIAWYRYKNQEHAKILTPKREIILKLTVLFKIRKRLVKVKVNMVVSCLTMVAGNGLQLQEVGDFEDENCLPPMNLIRSTKLHLTTEPPISCRCC
jgi:transposase